MPLPSIRVARLLLVTLAAPGIVDAQAASPSPSAAPLEWSATLRSRAEAWGWFDAGDEGRYAFLGSFLRAGLSQQLRGFGWRIAVMAPLLLGLPDDAVLPGPQGQLGPGAGYFAANDGARNPGDVFPKRAAQFYVDFVEAENSMGFHADQEAVRILGNSINFSRLGQAALRGQRVPEAPLVAAEASAHRPKRGAAGAR